jgi:hypothetical protein
MKQQKSSKNSSENGQVLVLMAFGLVVFLGFVALALDGGMAYSDRRRAQNGADAASLAGGGAAALSMENSHVFYSSFNCNGSKEVAAQTAAVTAAVNRAMSNQFAIVKDADTNGVKITCGQEMKNGFLDKYMDITVQVSLKTDTNFMHLFFSGELISNVQAVTRVRPRMPLAYGHAVVATGTEACSGNKYGVIVGGSSDTQINGGGIWSNGCLGINGTSYGVDITDGGINYVGGTDGNPSNMNPAPVKVSAPMPSDKYTVPAPNCSDPKAKHVDGRDLEGTLTPGLYCVSGNATLNGGETLQGSGVTIYMIDGSLTINGGASVNVEAPSGPNTAPAISGVLIYSAQSDVDLEGNASSAYLGLVYAPNGQIKAHGANGTTPTFNTQLVGHHVDISGNANIDINFNPELAYSKPSSLELYK